MSNVNNLKEIQFKKIGYFCSKTKINNFRIAERYLNEAMWDEKLAVQNYLKKHNNVDNELMNFFKSKMKKYEANQYIDLQKPPLIVNNNINNSENEEKINEKDENYIPLKITKAIDEHKFNNGPTCESLNYIKNSLKNVKIEFNNFLELAKDRIGIILIYNEDSFDMILKNKIKEIKKHVLYSVLNENYVIFPVLNNSPIGKELSRQFLCINYPSCLFCEYKKKEQLCVTKRMDGAFDVSFFYNCIPFEEKKKLGNSCSNNFKHFKNNNIHKNENDNIIKEIDNISNLFNKHNYNDNENPNNIMVNNQINNNLKDMNQKIEFNDKNENNNIGFNKDFEDKKKNEQKYQENNKKYNKINSQSIFQNNLDNYFMGNTIAFNDFIKQISNEQEDNPNNFNNNNSNEMNNKNPNQNEMNNLNKNINENHNDKYNNDNSNLFINKNNNSNKDIINNHNDKLDNNIPFINKNENLNKNINQNYNNKYDNFNPFINKNENNNNLNNINNYNNNLNNNNNNNNHNNNNNYNNNNNNNNNNYNNNNNNYNNNNYINNNINNYNNNNNYNNINKYDNYDSFINKNENSNKNSNQNYNDNPFINKNENSNKNINQNNNNKYESNDPYINKNENINKNLINNNKYDNNDPFANENENMDKKHNIMADSIYGLSDGQILAKREREIKELERQQLEKEEKEEEEKRKILEEENRIKKLNKKYIYEAKIVKMILSEEPEKDNPNACHIKFRHPDGEKIIERRFLKTDKIATLYDYVKSIGREIFMEDDAFDFELIGGFPPKSLEDKKNNTLEEEGMFPNYILQIKEK